MQPDTGKEKKRTRRINLIIPLLAILCLMIAMVIYTTRAINRVAVANVREVGEDKISSVAARMDNYLSMTKSVLWVTADAVDYMVRNDESNEQIHNYIVEETELQKGQFDENYTGIYGLIRGEYLDGLNWVPPEGYNPVERDWYKAAVAAGGECIIVSPYVDAQTGYVVITICRQLTNKDDVLAVDITMNRIQDMVADLKIKEMGYGFVVNEDGMIIAHPDEDRKGFILEDTEEQRQFMDKVLAVRNGNFEMKMEGTQRTVFVRQVLDQWYVIIAVSNDELYAESRWQLAVNVMICSIIFFLIALFYYLGHKNEQNFSRRMEEMKMEEQRQTYETRVLKLEKEAADQANKAKSDFLADMSHEIRTPINALLGMNEMIIRETADALEEESPEEQTESFRNIRSYAGNIENAGNNLLSIINDILDFSKIEAGKLEIAENDYELSSLIGDAISLISFRAKDKGLDLRIDVDETIPDGLYGDKVRIRQILMNLLSNAVKYTDRGSVTLHIGSKDKVFKPGETILLEIQVTDTGIGIREEDVEKLFTKFQRVDLNRNSTVEGTGLGLAITNSLLSMMGGTIHVDSTYGKGSTFTVTIPQKVVSCNPIGDVGIRNETRKTEYHETFRAPEARILVVDDTRINIDVTIGLLKKTGMQIDSAMSGAEAIEKAKVTAYDLILMDQRMPGTDGTEALRALREDCREFNTQTPVICMTADAIIGAKERYISEGFTDYLPKPVSGETLEKMLLRYLPKDKVTVNSQRKETEEATLADRIPSFCSELQAEGIETDRGLANCQQDGELYRSLLREYVSSMPENKRAMDTCFQEKNWKEYGILVHALKSSSRLIGAVALAEEAAELEKAAREGKEELIIRNHQAVMEKYQSISDIISRIVTGTENTEENNDSVLEFYPDE